jgi:hypothetical protein
MILDEGLDAFLPAITASPKVFAKRSRPGAWSCAPYRPTLFQHVSAIKHARGLQCHQHRAHAASTYGVAFGVGLGEVAGKVFRIGHLGSLTDVMALSGIATAEMCMADLGLDMTLGSGVAAAQNFIAATPRWRWPQRGCRLEGLLPMYLPTYDDVLAAHERIEPHIHRTPILTSSYLNDLTGAELFFKCENFQKAGAFKVRGASNAVFGLSDEDGQAGRRTHSSGNHALSLSYAAGRRGIPVQRGDAAHRARGQKGCRARLWRHHHRMRAIDHQPRGGLPKSKPRPAAISCTPTMIRA